MCFICRPPRRDGELEEFTLVYFRQTVEYDDDWVGHPENAEWFCNDHAPLTEGLTDLTAAEAMRRIRSRAQGEQSVYRT